MKPLQIMMDESLLKRLDADDEVRKDGRSAVVRRAVAEYLKQRRRRQIAESYRRGYASGVGEELTAWVGEGTWPDESRAARCGLTSSSSPTSGVRSSC